jgi:competence protein ComGC
MVPRRVLLLLLHLLVLLLHLLLLLLLLLTVRSIYKGMRCVQEEGRQGLCADVKRGETG